MMRVTIQMKMIMPAMMRKIIQGSSNHGLYDFVIRTTVPPKMIEVPEISSESYGIRIESTAPSLRRPFFRFFKICCGWSPAPELRL